MAKAKVILDQQLDLSEQYRVELKVFEVEKSKKFPDGIKVSFTLIDILNGTPRLLIDNHEPYGFHVHTGLPKDKTMRGPLKIKDYLEALDKFWKLVKEVMQNED